MESFSFEYWFMFPLAIIVSTTANAAGFSGGTLFQPIYYFFLKVPIHNSVATGIATETIGMTSGSIRYLYYKMVDLPIGFTILLLAIPGIIFGTHALAIIPGLLLKVVVGFILLFLTTVQLINAIKKTFGTKEAVPVEDIYPYMPLPPVSGFLGATTGTGLAEMMQPFLEKKLGLQPKKANATAIMIQAIGDWITSILNIHSGFIIWEIFIFSGAGSMIGGQLGSWLSRYLPARLLKVVFSVCVMVIAVFYLYEGVKWIRSEYLLN